MNDFLHTHARVRTNDASTVETTVQRTVAMANELTGEPVRIESRMTELSGGQTRALLIADATVICDTPIVLLDEVENAGIHRNRALELLRAHKKIFIFVTHDPHIALLSDYRLVMRDGAVAKVLHTDEAERSLSLLVAKLDHALSRLRERIRLGERLQADALEGLA